MTLVVVGSGIAGLSAAEAARKARYPGPIVLVGEETHLPYDRPPLSKQVLNGAWTADRVALRRPESYAESGVDLMLGCRATGLDPAARQVILNGGDSLHYDKLMIATGVRPATLPFMVQARNLHVLRTIEDTQALQATLGRGGRLAVIGAGFMGTEVAAAARGLGLGVTVVDPLSEPLANALGDWVGAQVRELHERRGVRFRLGVGVTGLRSDAAGVSGVRLTDGTTIDVDAVVVAVGSRPNIEWLAGTGLTTSAGVICDEYCMASPDIAAAGDVAAWHHPALDRLIRVEHRMNAQEQGAAAGTNLVLEPAVRTPFAPVPYFWSDQYDVKIQAYGTMPADSDLSLAAGDPSSGKFVVTYRQHGRLVGALGWNAPRETRGYRALIAERSAERVDERPLTSA